MNLFVYSEDHHFHPRPKVQVDYTTEYECDCKRCENPTHWTVGDLTVCDDCYETVITNSIAGRPAFDGCCAS